MTILIVVVVLLILIFWLVGMYNGLVRARNFYKNAFAQIDIQLKRRYDLIPNLVETAKGYMKHERETLEAVVAARNQAVQAVNQAAAAPGDNGAITQLNNANGQLNSALSRLLMVCESYPDLKANQNMLMIQEELTSTENKVAFARQGYNDAATDFNNRCGTFPTSIFASMFGFKEATLLEAIENKEERNVPKVSF